MNHKPGEGERNAKILKLVGLHESIIARKKYMLLEDDLLAMSDHVYLSIRTQLLVTTNRFG